MGPKRAREQRRIDRDDERDLCDIATAMLLGCTWYQALDNDGGWWVTADFPTHPIEDEHSKPGGASPFESKADLARAYTKWALNNNSLDETQA